MNMAQLPLAAILYSLLHSIAFLNLILGAVGHDILFADQQLVTGQTLVSRNQIFEMGFFFPGKSTHRFLGIWYKRTPDVVFWVGNRNNPVSTSQAPVFMISRKGDLAISSGKSIIWSVNSSTVASSPVLQLLDSGNLVLINNNATCIWQSFDYPSDTLLPGMKLVDDKDAGVERYLTSWRNPDDPSPGDIVIKIHNPGLPNIVILRGVTKRYRVGQWNGIYFWGGVDFPNSIFKPEMVFREERLISIGEPYKTLILERITIDSSGALVRHHMNSRKDKWIVAYTFPRDSCDEYASCGPNSICRSDRTVRCQCFRGFAPKFQKDWDLQDLSGGCARVTRVNCHGGDGFLQIRGVKYPDLLSFWVNSTLNLDGCRDECLQNCSCTAYANPFITNGGSGCLLWFDELMDTKALSDAHSKQNIYIRVPLSELDSNMGLDEEKEQKRPMRLILISIATGVLVSAIINGSLLFMTRRKGKGNNCIDIVDFSIKIVSSCS